MTRTDDGRVFALLFPGQGSEEPGMGLAMAEHDAGARRLLELASHHAGLDVARAIERGARALGRTEVAQPALVAVSLGIARAVAQRVAIDHVLGHSLGDLSAACLALDVPDDDALALAAVRGRAMADAAEAHPGAMLAVRSADREALAPALALGVTLAAHNAPDEHVLSGDRDAIAAAERALALPTTRLAVAGAWHSAAMEPAVAPYRAAIARHLSYPATQRAELPGRAPRCAIVSSTEGRVLAPDEVPEALARALLRPVRFVDALRASAARGITDLVAVAPSRVVRALARRTLGRAVTLHAIDHPRDLDALGR